MTNEIQPFNGGIQVVQRASVFDRRNSRVKVVKYAHQSIEDLYRDSDLACVPCTCSHAGELIPRDQWPVTFVSSSDSVIFTPVLHENAGKAILGAILIIVAVVLWVYAPQFGAQWTELARQGAFLIGAFGASLLITGVMPPPPVEGEKITTWSPQTTQKLGGCVPKYYGRHKMTGNIIASSIENMGEKQYIYALISLGVGPYRSIYKFKINNVKTDLLTTDPPQIAVRKGFLTQDPLPGFEDTVVEYPASQKLLTNEPYTLQTTGSEFDKLKIHLLFPQGLGYVNDNGSLREHTVWLQVKVKKSTASAWTTIPSSKTSYVTEGENYLNRWVLMQQVEGVGYSQGGDGDSSGEGSDSSSSSDSDDGGGSCGDSCG